MTQKQITKTGSTVVRIRVRLLEPKHARCNIFTHHIINQVYKLLLLINSSLLIVLITHSVIEVIF